MQEPSNLEGPQLQLLRLISLTEEKKHHESSKIAQNEQGENKTSNKSHKPIFN